MTEPSPFVLDPHPGEGWLRLDAPERFVDVAARAAEAHPDCRRWRTIEGLNDWPVRRYATGWRHLATGHLLRALDHQLAGHALARAVLPAGSEVEVGLVAHGPYELRQLLVDVLEAPGNGIDRQEIGPYLRERRAEHERVHPPRTPRQRLRRRLTASAIPLELALPRAIAAAYESARVVQA